MRKEAIRVYNELAAGKTVGEIDANPKTKSAVNKKYLYEKLISIMVSDIIKNKYTFSTSDLAKLINKKNQGR